MKLSRQHQEQVDEDDSTEKDQRLEGNKTNKVLKKQFKLSN